MAYIEGLSMIHTAKVLSDTSSLTTYDVPVLREGARKINFNPKIVSGSIASDDRVSDRITRYEEAEIGIERKYLSPSDLSEFLGCAVDSNGVVRSGTTDDAPYFAVGYRRKLGGETDSYVYVWILKSKFNVPTENGETENPDSFNPQFEMLNGTAISRSSDGDIKITKVANGAYSSTWFTQATLQALRGATSPTAIALSTIVPANGGTNISKSTTIVITFNNKIQSESISVVKADGTVVSFTKAWDVDGKILTITPSTTLSGSTLHIVNVNGVTDIYGQVLTATTKTFTTTA